MKFFFALLLLSQVAFANDHIHERKTITKANFLATGIFTEQKHHPWPFPLLSIGHNMQSYQNYDGSPYWHDGLDIRANQDQPIYSPVGGKVVNIENYIIGNPMYWEVAILDDEGFVWKFHHVARETITKEIQDAYRTREKVRAGVLIGNVVRWPISTFGEIYHHCHLLVVAADGKYINPFLMMEPLADTAVPVINKIGIAQNHTPTDLKEVKGPHALYLDASDLTLHTKFLLPPYKITTRLDGGEEKTVWEFINLPSGKNDTDYISDFYMDGTCSDYSCRKFYFNLNFTTTKPRGQMTLPPGKHSVDVTVEDIVGNKSSKSFEWKVL
jgi:hypothetical protein